MAVATKDNSAVYAMKPAATADAVNQPLANAKARFGGGAALASMLVDETMQQASKLKMFLQSLAELDQDGRAGFTDYLKAIQRERQALVKENGTKVYKKINASAAVRLSEFRKVAEALDMGHTLDLNQNYHTIIGQARQYIEDVKGRAETRGPKKKPAIIKAINYLKKLEADAVSPEDKAMIAALEGVAKEYAVEAGLEVEGAGPEAPM